MHFQPLVLASLVLGLSTGCNEQSTPPSEPPGESKPAIQAPGSAQPGPSEPGAEPQKDADTAATPRGEPAVYVVKISGVRCIAAPCPTHMATPANDPAGDAIMIHELDLSALNFPSARLEALQRQLDTSSVKLEATLGTRPNAGPAGAATVLHVKRVVDGE